MTRLASALLAVPATVRSQRRSAAMEAAVPGLATRGLAALGDVDPAAARVALAAATLEIARRWPSEATPTDGEMPA